MEADEQARALADPEQLEQVIMILLSNAIKHSGRVSPVRVRVEDRRVAVEDEGEGISAEELPRIFERFYKGRGSGGFGLGLSICRDLVEGMGGSVRASSEEGAGSTFEMELREAEEDVQDTGG